MGNVGYSVAPHALKKKIASSNELSNNIVDDEKSLFKKTKSLNNSKLLNQFLCNNENNYFKIKKKTNENICEKCNVEMIFYSQ